MIKVTPELVIERSKGNFQNGQSRKDYNILICLIVIPLSIFPISALDYRFEIFMFGLVYKLVGWFLILISLIILYKVYTHNTYLSRSIVIQEEREQKVIDSGPYGIVRHPMYSATILMVFGVIMILGSGIALILGLLVSTGFYLRAISEETLLKNELAGYEEYTQKVKKRLIPYIL